MPAVAFVAGIPGHSYTSNYTWQKFPEDGNCLVSDAIDYDIWCSSDAFHDPNDENPNFSWYENNRQDTTFTAVVFDVPEQ
mgnify:CR=1 FL=1